VKLLPKRVRNPRTNKLTISITPELRAALEAEAWECERTVSDYVYGLLTRRGKWARSVTGAPQYDIGPEKIVK